MRKIDKLGMRLAIGAALALPSLRALAAELPTVELSGQRVVVGRLALTVGAIGLPEQIEIAADPAERPPAAPGATGVTNTSLAAFGRGPQLRTPARLEVLAGGTPLALQVTQPAKLRLTDGAVACTASLQAETVRLDLDLRYTRDGALRGTLAYDTGSRSVDSIALVFDLLGAIDTVVAGAPVREPLQAAAPADCAVPEGEGLAWGNAAVDASHGVREGARALPGVVPHLFVGSGDRGFTWLSDPAGWTCDPAASTLTLTRDREGQVTWRVLFQNRTGTSGGPRKVAFMLLTHPAARRPPTFRSEVWLNQPVAAGAPGEVPPLTLKSRLAVAAPLDLVRADAATLYEAYATRGVLAGVAGGDALSAQQDHVRTYPMGLFRYLAATHTGVPMLLRSNSGSLITPGMARATDRVLIARALLHDAGLDASRLAHRGDLPALLARLREFGYFEGDGRTEFVPYWRTQRLARFGETFTRGDAFALEDDPTAGLYLGLYRRPVPGSDRAWQVLIVVANERDQAVREQLYVLDPGALFGGPNAWAITDATARIAVPDFPAASDWGAAKLRQQGDHRVVLEDIEDHGVVFQAAAKGGLETYGPSVYVPAHGFRVFYGRGK